MFTEIIIIIASCLICPCVIGGLTALAIKAGNNRKSEWNVHFADKNISHQDQRRFYRHFF